MAPLLLVLLAACADPTDSADTEDTGGDDGACGDPVTYDLDVRAKVVDAGEQAAAGIEVVLDDRGWTYEVLGGGTTGADGEVTFAATGVTSLADCWGTVLNYQLVATDPADTSRTAEKGINTQLHAAIDAGEGVVDLREFPLTLP